jgi:Calx-beta domain
MSLWQKPRYYCTNLAGACRYAANDVPFSTRYFKRHEGRCRGHSKDGCDQPLALGEPEDLRLRWAALTLLTVGAIAASGWWVRSTLFPPPLQHIAFSALETHTDDRAGSLELSVVRDRDLQRRIEVEYASADGSAKSGEDYQPIHDRLVFEPGERSKSIRVTLVPDRTFTKEKRYFSLSLVNVLGAPTETIEIAPRTADRAEAQQAEQSVLSASRIAADIAGFMVKRRVLMRLVTSREGSQNDAKEFQQQLEDVDGNLIRAREGYLQSLKDLQTFEAPVVIHAIDHLHTDLEDRHFAQQSRALQIMRSHFMELSEKKSPDMDRWVEELESAVPHIDPRNPETST